MMTPSQRGYFYGTLMGTAYRLPNGGRAELLFPLGDRPLAETLCGIGGVAVTSFRPVDYGDYESSELAVVVVHKPE